MFCGNCGAQVPDGSSVCPNCGAQMAAKSQAPQFNQQSLNAAGAKAKGFAEKATKNLDSKKIGMIAAAVVAAIVVIFILKAIFGGSGLKGTYTDGYNTITFSGNKMTCSTMGMEFTVKYKIKGDELVVDAKSLKLSDKTLDYLEDENDMDKDEIKEYIEELKEDMGEDASMEFEYDKKKKIIELNDSEYYYAENYKVGPSGKFTCEEDEDITITFKNGKATYDDDGDDETLTYYCFDDGDNVYIAFYGDDLDDSEYYEKFYTSKIKIEDEDEFQIGNYTFEK